jgi:hypothetical protein
MTPEEINRTIEFILQTQARIEARNENHAEKMAKYDEILKDLAVLNKELVETSKIQSNRLDRAEEADRAAQKRHDELQKRHNELMRELRQGINQIMDKLGGSQ